MGIPRRRVVVVFCVVLLLGILFFLLPTPSLFTTPLRVMTVAWYGTPEYFNCSTEHFLTFQPQGRLGNIICEYATLLRMHFLYSVPVAVHPDMWFTLKPYFPSLSLRPISYDCLDEIGDSSLPVRDSEAVLAAGERGRWLIKGTPCNLTQFWPTRSVWRDDLLFSQALRYSARQRRDALTESWRRGHTGRDTKYHASVTCVGVHVRRSDFVTLLLRYNYGDLLPPEYYIGAFQYYRERMDPVLFFIITEPSERPWCQQHLQAGTDDVIVVDDGASDEEDLALLSSFDHIVYSHGTFGLWGILLSNATTVTYPAKYGNPELKRYSHYRELDHIQTIWSGVNFNKISIIVSDEQ